MCLFITWAYHAKLHPTSAVAWLQRQHARLALLAQVMADAWEAYFALPHWGFNKEGVDMALTDEASRLAAFLAWPRHRQAPVAAGGARCGMGP